MQWTDIVGHDEQQKALRHMEACGRMPHAVLLAGPSGIGKLMVAKVLATMLLCQGAQPAPCGSCQSCQQVTYGTHPDLVQVVPDGANIKIEQIRNLQQEVALTPYISTRRVCIIDGAELMTVQAANSLLKVLEEPVGDVVFILVAANQQMLLPTIISRCMTVTFQPLADSILAQALAGKGFSPLESTVAARLSRGRMGTALTLLAPDGLVLRNQAVTMIQELTDNGMKNLWDTALLLDKMERKDFLQVLSYLTYLFRDLVMIVTGQQQDILFNVDLVDWLHGQSQGWSEERLVQALKVVENSRRAVNANANARLTSEALLIKIYDLTREV